MQRPLFNGFFTNCFPCNGRDVRDRDTQSIHGVAQTVQASTVYESEMVDISPTPTSHGMIMNQTSRLAGWFFLHPHVHVLIFQQFLSIYISLALLRLFFCCSGFITVLQWFIGCHNTCLSLLTSCNMAISAYLHLCIKL